MKILQVGKIYPWKGGLETVRESISEGISAMGYDCDLLAQSPTHKSYSYVLNEHWHVETAATWIKLYSTLISPDLIIKLKYLMMNYDIIHVHHPDPMTALALKLSGYKGKVVIHWHSDILNQRFLLRFYQPLQTWLINRADTIIATSLVYAKNSTAISKYMDKVTIVPIGIQEPIHNMSKVDIWKQKYAGKKIIFSLGRLVSYKGFKYLIKASKYLPNDYVCLIGGTGPLKKELEKEINDLHVETKTVLLGRVEEDDLCALYEACELFCLPSISKTEAFGVVLIEAMSYSKPIVTSNIIGSGVPWVNVQGKTGFNVTPQNSRDLALAIQKICENPSIKSVFGTNSRIRFETLFRKNTMVEKIYDVYRRLVPND